VVIQSKALPLNPTSSALESYEQSTNLASKDNPDESSNPPGKY
jgi:hypothetical protein